MLGLYGSIQRIKFYFLSMLASRIDFGMPFKLNSYSLLKVIFFPLRVTPFKAGLVHLENIHAFHDTDNNIWMSVHLLHIV